MLARIYIARLLLWFSRRCCDLGEAMLRKEGENVRKARLRQLAGR